MGYSILLRIWALIPKWLLVGLVACFFAYFTGVSHGREPYKLAAKLQEAKTKVIARTFDQTERQIQSKGQKANEAIKDFECIAGAGVADWLSGIGAN